MDFHFLLLVFLGDPVLYKKIIQIFSRTSRPVHTKKTVEYKGVADERFKGVICLVTLILTVRLVSKMNTKIELYLMSVGMKILRQIQIPFYQHLPSRLSFINNFIIHIFLLH